MAFHLLASPASCARHNHFLVNAMDALCVYQPQLHDGHELYPRDSVVEARM